MGIKIEKPKLVLVEGGHEVQFIECLLDFMQIDDLQVEQVGSKYFDPTLEGITKVRGFDAITSLGIIRDADSDFDATFQSVQGTLRKLSFSVPDQPLTLAGNNPSVAIFICPDNNNSGSLEDLCLLSVARDPSIDCVNRYIECLEGIQGVKHPHKSKAMIQVFLAKEPDGDIHMGIAAKREIWDWSNSAFDQIKEFIHLL